MRVLRSAATAFLVIALSACTAPADPFLEKVRQAVSKTAFTSTGQMASGCIGLYLLCTQPMYEPSFKAESSAGAERVCSDFIALANRLGSVAYSTESSGAYRLPKDTGELLQFCTEGFETKLKNTDGSFFYQGLNILDDGKIDGFGKAYVLSRGNSANPDDYFLVISFSKDLSRVGSFEYATEKPKHLTQEQIDNNN